LSALIFTGILKQSRPPAPSEECGGERRERIISAIPAAACASVLKIMKLGFGLYRHQLNPDHFRFARQCGATQFRRGDINMCGWRGSFCF
jgi:hypothetical protein